MRERTVTHHFKSNSTQYEEVKVAILKFEEERFPKGEETQAFFRVGYRPPGEEHSGETTLIFTSRADLCLGFKSSWTSSSRDTPASVTDGRLALIGIRP